MTQTMRQFKNGIIDQNPTLVLLLGLCPALAATTTMMNAAGMGLTTMAVLLGSNIIISSLRKLIPAKVRIAAFTVIIAALVTVADLLLQAYFPALSEALGIFIPLIVVNCILFAQAELFAYRNGVVRSAIDGLTAGMGFLAALIAVAALRELLSAGTLFDFRVLPEAVPEIAVMAQPPGGFFALGLVIAATQAVRKRGKARETV
ncbi:MAG: electron transport complex subunit RsxE [Oscillospiraceae bacterium]|nr:electron transport complex subunit RsxE [Oscillospiraceae bacterium]